MRRPISVSVMPFVRPQLGVEHRRQHHAVAAAGAVPLVLPGGGVRVVHLALDRDRAAAGSRRRASIGSSPPSRTHSGRQASSPFEARV